MGKLETNGYYALGLPLLGLLLLFELLLSRRRGRPIFSFAETLSNLSCGLGTLLIGLFTGGTVLHLYEWAYQRFAIINWHGSLLRWPFALLLTDFCYYLHHRAGHRFAFLWSIHGVHHQHEQLNSSVGFRLEWFADISTLFFFSLLPLLGIDSYCGFLAIAFLSLYALTTHSPVLSRPTFGLLVTPATHGAHHSRDQRYADKNFASMFLFWDKLLGTHSEPAPFESLQLDVPTICRLHDGVGAQWSLVRELFQTLGHAPSIRAALALLIARPQIRPGDQFTPPRDDSALGRPVKLYLLADFVMTTVLATWLLWLGESSPLWFRLTIAALMLWSLRNSGRLLDGRPQAWQHQTLRVCATTLLGLTLTLSKVQPLFGLLTAILATLNLTALLSGVSRHVRRPY